MFNTKSVVFTLSMSLFALALAPSCSADAPLPPRLAKFDKNGDGRIQKDEMPPAWQSKFEEADKNKDGSLDRDELRALLGAGAGAGGGGGAEQAAPVPVLTGTDAQARLTRLFDSQFGTSNVAGAAAIIVRDGKVMFQRQSGNITASTIVPIASATKWYHAALTMSLVDAGILSLDKPLSSYLPEATGPVGQATLRQMLAHTSGIDPDLVVRETYVPSKDQVATMLAAKLLNAPGAEFRYGGADLQIAAYVAERVTGKAWNDLFLERIATPLGLKSTGFGASKDQGAAGSPEFGSGVRSTADDYIVFLTMLAANGEYQGKRVLSEASAREIRRNQTGTIPMAKVPPLPGVDTWRYGLGVWCEAIDVAGNCPIVNSTGLFGTMPFMDENRKMFGVIVIQDRLPKVWRGLQAFRRELERAADGK